MKARGLFLARKAWARLLERWQRWQRDRQGTTDVTQPEESPLPLFCEISAGNEAELRKSYSTAVQWSEARQATGISNTTNSIGSSNLQATSKSGSSGEGEERAEEQRLGGTTLELNRREAAGAVSELGGRVTTPAPPGRAPGGYVLEGGMRESPPPECTGRREEGSRRGAGQERLEIPREEGYGGGYWPSEIPKAIAHVVNGLVLPPWVPSTTEWEVLDPPQWPECMIKPEVWEGLLKGYPDAGLISMLKEGCATGYEGRRMPLYSANSSSCYKLSEVVEAKLKKEEAAEQIVRCMPGESLMISPFAFIPKSDGGKRMIRNLSAPEGEDGEDPVSVNANIPDSSLPPLALVDINDFIILAGEWRAAGFRELELLRVDASDAYRRVPIRVRDRWQLGMEWKGQRFKDAALPMGLKSSCHLFQRWTLAFSWWLARQGMTGGGYLDDMILLGPEGRVDGWGEVTRTTMDRGGMMHSTKKREEDGPAASAGVALGYWLDLKASTVSLTEEKRARLLKQLRRFIRATSVRRGELSQLVGWLGHALRVVPHLRCFMGGLYHHPGAFAHRRDRRWVRLQPAAKVSCRRWLAWLRKGQPTRMFSLWGCRGRAVTVYTDASLWGGAFWSPQLGCVWWRWEDMLPNLHLSINVLEAITLVAMMHLWRPMLQGSPLRIRTDNQAALGAIRKGHSSDSPRLQAAVMRWGEEVAWLGGSVAIHMDWVASAANLFADACSRNPLGTSQADRKALPWRRLLEESDRPPQMLRRPDAWWRSWTARLDC